MLYKTNKKEGGVKLTIKIGRKIEMPEIKSYKTVFTETFSCGDK